MRLFPLARTTALLATSISCSCFACAIGAPAETDSSLNGDYSTITVRAQNNAQYDLAKLQAQGKIVFVSSGAIAFGNKLIDNDSQTVFRFSGNDLHPTVVLELADQKELNRVGATFNHQDGAKLDVFLVAQLPKNFNQLDGAIACNSDPSHPDQASAEVQQTNARYVIYRWTRSKPTSSPFVVAELSAFSNARPNEAPPLLAANGIQGAEVVDKVGVSADPPSIRIVSP